MTHDAPLALCIGGTLIMVIGLAMMFMEEGAPITAFAMQVASTMFIGAIAWSLAS